MVRKEDDPAPLLEDLRKRFSKASAKAAQIYNDLRYTIQELAQRQHLDEDACRRLSVKIRAYLESLHDPNISWENVEYHDIIDLRDPALEWKAVKIKALLEKMTEPVVVAIGQERHLSTTMTFRDVIYSDRIESIPTVNTCLIRFLERQKQEYHTFDVLGTIVLIPIRMGLEERFRLMVHEMRPAETPLQMICAKQAEIKEAKSTIKELRRKKRTVFEHILETLVKGLGIEGLDRAPELMKSLEAVIVQAVSDFWINNASAKIHNLIIGAPAVGKKLLTQAAECLNPVFQEAHPSKATAAGVCSTAIQQDGLWVSKPGYLPLAHRGVFAIQDFHSVKDAQREKLLGILNMVMEDGKVIDSTAARQTHPALTSIHLDTNKRTDLFPDSQLRGDTIVAKRLDDIRIPMTILSRFDFIIDIPRDATRQMEIALAMYNRPDTVQTSQGPNRQRADWMRKLQVLVALLRTPCTFPESIRRYMRARQEQMWKEIEESLQKIPWVSDFQARLTNSAFKFVAAYARMENRQEPTKEDVDRAFGLIRCKFQFIATLGLHLRLPKGGEVPEGHQLEQWLLEHFAGRTVKTGEVLQAYQEAFGLPVVRRTIERHLPQVAQKIRQGIWDFSDNRPAGTVPPMEKIT